MPNNYFTFKKFHIDQEQVPMKVSVDGVLLGALANTKDAKSVLDIGTGTGLIALMVAQRAPNATIKAVELLKEVAVEAKKNVDNSPFHHQIEVIHSSIQKFAHECPQLFDLIVSNPPWFSNCKESTDSGRAIARHDNNLPLDELLWACNRLLTDNGIIEFIIPTDRFKDFENQANKMDLFCTEMVKIRHFEHKHHKRIVAQFKRTHQECIESTLTIKNKDNSYTQAYILLTREYYLYF